MTLSPLVHEQILAEPPPLLDLVASLLRDQSAPEAGLPCTLLPSDDQYAIRLGEAVEGPAVLLPRRPLERALSEPQARARVRQLLRMAIETLRGHRASAPTPLTAYFTALDVRSLPGPRCMSCEGPLLAEAPVVIRDGARAHLACPPAW